MSNIAQTNFLDNQDDSLRWHVASYDLYCFCNIFRYHMDYFYLNSISVIQLFKFIKSSMIQYILVL